MPGATIIFLDPAAERKPRDVHSAVIVNVNMYGMHQALAQSHILCIMYDMLCVEINLRFHAMVTNIYHSMSLTWIQFHCTIESNHLIIKIWKKVVIPSWCLLRGTGKIVMYCCIWCWFPKVPQKCVWFGFWKINDCYHHALWLQMIKPPHYVDVCYQIKLPMFGGGDQRSFDWHYTLIIYISDILLIYKRLLSLNLKFILFGWLRPGDPLA